MRSIATTSALGLLLCCTPLSVTSGAIVRPSAITCDLGGDTGAGFLVLSASLPGSKVNGTPHRIFFDYNPVGASRFSPSQSNVLISRHGPIRLMSAPSDFDGLFGHLYVLKLKAGDYEFSGWKSVDNRDFEATPTRIGRLPFHIDAGRATYVGSFETQLFIGKDTLGRQVAEPWVTVMDHQARDIDVFAKKCPAFDRALLDVRIMDPTPWR